MCRNKEALPVSSISDARLDGDDDGERRSGCEELIHDQQGEGEPHADEVIRSHGLLPSSFGFPFLRLVAASSSRPSSTHTHARFLSDGGTSRWKDLHLVQLPKEAANEVEGLPLSGTHGHAFSLRRDRAHEQHHVLLQWQTRIPSSPTLHTRRWTDLRGPPETGVRDALGSAVSSGVVQLTTAFLRVRRWSNVDVMICNASVECHALL